jgi:predicted deacylase
MHGPEAHRSSYSESTSPVIPTSAPKEIPVIRRPPGVILGRMGPTPIRTTVAFDRPGKQHDHLCVPYSYNLGGWANLLLPITVVANGQGRTALVTAGNHGDEYPGQVAVLRLMPELTPDQVRGRVILVPALNPPAARAGTRLSPLDGKKFNRCFPGRPDGTVTEVIAHYVSAVLFPLADVVIDIHTGGRSMDFYPCAHVHLVPDRQRRRQMAEGTLAWNTDFASRSPTSERSKGRHITCPSLEAFRG